MTFERRCTIEPTDFVALIYECGTCGASTRIPMDKIAPSSFAGLITRPCSQCGSPTGIGQGTLEYDTVAGFSESARNLAETAKGRNLKIKMELKCANLDGEP